MWRSFGSLMAQKHMREWKTSSEGMQKAAARPSANTRTLYRHERLNPTWVATSSSLTGMESPRPIFNVDFDREPLGLIPDSLKEPVALYPMPTWPATFHNPRRYGQARLVQLPKHLQPGYRTYPQAIKALAGRLFGIFRRQWK